MSISNNDDVIDSRDVEERITELQDSIDSTYETFASEQGDDATPSKEAWLNSLRDEDQPEVVDEADELDALIALREDAQDHSSDWTHGAALIRDTYWVEYVEQLLIDIGDLPRDLPGYLVIDWDKTAQNIQVDYTSVEFDGVTYWVR